MKIVSLGEVASIERNSVDPSRIPSKTPYIGLEHIRRGGRIVGVSTVGCAGLKSAKFRFTESDVLFGKLRPNLGKIARPDFSGVCSTDILPIHPTESLDRGYLAHFLAQPEIIDFAASRATGANLPRLSPKILAQFQVALPSLTEQRRIASILDKADSIRVKRRQVLAHLDELNQSLFQEIFFGIEIPEVPASEVILEMRNGLSPSKSATFESQVLTLTSVTTGTFDPKQVKLGNFDSNPSSRKRIQDGDFLICRGNGNIRLVGRGVYPGKSNIGMVFPDTVIAASLDRSIVDPTYFSMVWLSNRVRAQIESVARTTNGTYKVSQESLSTIMLPVAPIATQREFARRARLVNERRRAVNGVADNDEELFTSLQSRAFKGEL